MLKKLFFIGLLLAGWYKRDAYHFFNSNLPASVKTQGGANPLKVRGSFKGHGVLKHIPFAKTQRKDFDFPELAMKDSFTIIDFTADTCSICLAMEPAYRSLVQRRSDVSVVRIDLPNGSGFTASSQAEFDKLQKKLEDENKAFAASMDRFEICGTPHVVIVDPNGKVFVADSCTKKPGFDFVKAWLDKEGIAW